MISVIIPCHNYGHLLAETLQSLREQSFPGWEALVIDSASTDNTRDVVSGYMEKDPRVTYFYNEKGGVSSSRNMGLKNAKGNYIQFLDADDLLQPGKFAADLAIFEKHPTADAVYSTALYFAHPSADKLYTSYKLDQTAPTPIKISPFTPNKELLSHLVNGNIFAINSVLLKISPGENILFDEHINHNEDWHFWCLYALSGKKFCYYDAKDAKALIRVHSSSVSQNELKMLCGGVKVCRALLHEPKLQSYKNVLIKKYTAHRYRIFRMLLEETANMSAFREKLTVLENTLGDKEMNKLKNLSEKSNSRLKLYLRIRIARCVVKLRLNYA